MVPGFSLKLVTLGWLCLLPPKLDLCVQRILNTTKMFSTICKKKKKKHKFFIREEDLAQLVEYLLA